MVAEYRRQLTAATDPQHYMIFTSIIVTYFK